MAKDYKTIIKITDEEKNKIIDNSPKNLPLNPSAQGYSGAEIRKRLYQSTVGEDGSLLALLERLVDVLTTELNAIETDKADVSYVDTELDKKVDKTVYELAINDLENNKLSVITFNSEKNTMTVYVDTKANTAKSEAQSYADTKDASVLLEAKAYTDTKIADVEVGNDRTYIDAQDSTTLNQAKSYTDGKIDSLIANAPATYDTLKEIADYIASDQTFSQSILLEIAGLKTDKVDKISGMGLSSNDFTDLLKIKLDGIEAGAEVNVQSDWTQEVNTADDYIKNKPAIPTKTSDLTNDTGYITGYTETDPIFTAWDKSTGISITKSQITDLIEATQAISGLMSATDKQRLDVLHALLEEDTANNVVDSINEILAIFNNYPEGADLVSALSGKVDKNNAITAGTKTKITYDAKGLVTSGADLEESDIPPLSTSKITQTTTAKFVSDTEKSTWNGKQDKLVAGDNISIIDNTISASCGGDAYLANTQTFTGVNTFTQTVNLNRSMSSLLDPALTFNIAETGNAKIRVVSEGHPEQSTTTFMLIPTKLGGYETIIHTGNVKTINDQSILGSGNIELQQPLISGTNIKTINNQSILGSGNIAISGGGADLSTQIITLPFANWTLITDTEDLFYGYYTQTTEVLGVDLESVIWLDSVNENYNEYIDAEIKGIGQGLDEITFIAIRNPGIDVNVKVVLA